MNKLVKWMASAVMMTALLGGNAQAAVYKADASLGQSLLVTLLGGDTGSWVSFITHVVGKFTTSTSGDAVVYATRVNKQETKFFGQRCQLLLPDPDCWLFYHGQQQ